MIRAVRAAGGVALLCLFLCSEVRAASVWNNASGGLYSAPGNWTGGVPTAGTAVTYGINGTYTVNVDVAANHGATQFSATNANVTLNITGPGYTIPSAVDIGAATGTNTVSVSGSKFDPTNVEIAPTAGGTGTLTLNGPMHSTAVAVGGLLSVSGGQTNETLGGTGTFNLNAGADATINTLLADVAGGGSKINFNAGTLTLMGVGRSTGSKFSQVGNGTNAATLNLLNGTSAGQYSLGGTFTISNNALLNLNSPGGSLTVGNLVRDVSGSAPGVFNWTAGKLYLTNGSVTISPSGLFGSSLDLSANRTLSISSSGSTTLPSGGSITVNGGELSTPYLTVNPGGTVIFESGEVNVTASDLEIGPNGITHSGGVTLNNSRDWVSAFNGNISIAAGQSLTLNAGLIASHTLSNSGSFTFNSGYVQVDGPITIGPTGQINSSPNLTIASDSQLSSQGDITIQPSQTVTLSGGGLFADHIVSNGILNYESGNLGVYHGDLVVGPTGQVRLQSNLSIGAYLQAPLGTITFQEALTVGFNNASFNVKNSIIEGDVTLTYTNGFGGDSVTIASSSGTAKLTVGNYSTVSPNQLYRGNLVVNGGTVSATTMAPPTGLQQNTSLTVNAGSVSAATMQVGGMPGYVDTFTMNGGTFTSSTNFVANQGAASKIVFNAGQIRINNAQIDGPSPFVIGNGSSTAQLVLSGITPTLTFADGVIVSTNAELNGIGNLTGNVTNFGKIQPGLQTSIGTLTVNGSVVNSGTLVMDVSSTTRDKLIVNGTFDAGGVISIVKSFSFTPAIGASFDLLDFSTFVNSGYVIDLTSASLSSGRRWDVSQFPIDGTIRVVAGLTGDFSGDGHIDSADYVMWRKGLPAKYTSDDFATWRNQFGLNSPGSGAALGASKVPEPATGGVLLTAAAVMVVRRWKRRHSAVFRLWQTVRPGLAATAKLSCRCADLRYNVR